MLFWYLTVLCPASKLLESLCTRCRFVHQECLVFMGHGAYFINMQFTLPGNLGDFLWAGNSCEELDQPLLCEE